MIRRNLLLEERIGLHLHEIRDVAEGGLDYAVVVCCAVELGTHDLGHEGAGLGCVVCLVSVREKEMREQ